uniref:C2H2-type domain-containing protein n=1 Tax=Strigamia maritima TaxID=126957 RepID=T1JNC7_STRMM
MEDHRIDEDSPNIESDGNTQKNTDGSSLVYIGDKTPKSERGFPVFHCDQCEYETFSLATLSSHRKTHAVKKLFQCDICHMKFSQAANMRRHRMRHTGIKPFECRVCCKRFFRKDHLMEHTVTHAKQSPFRCPLCDKDFHRQVHLRDHLNVEHNNDNAVIPSLSDRTCRVCGHRAATAKGAKLHYTSRHNRKPNPEMSIRSEESNVVNSYSPYPIYPPGIISLINPVLRSSSSPPPAQVSSSGYVASGEQRGDNRVLIKKEVEEGTVENCLAPPTPDSSRPQAVGMPDGCGSFWVNGGLQCCHCGIIFPDQTLYFLHKGLHSEGNPWKCNICGELSQDKYEFNAHVLSKAHQ